MTTSNNKRSSMKPWAVMLLLVLALILIIGGIWGFNTYKMIQGFKAMGVPKQTISTTQAAEQEWQPQVHAVGTLRAVRGADISAEVAGVVESVPFTSGSSIKQGEPLLSLRSGDDLARLNSLKANADLAEGNYTRDQALLEAQAISQAQLDNTAAILKSAKAQVAEQQALLNKKNITAPFAGTLGVRNVDVGQYLQPGTKIVTLQTLDPIFVDFFVPQQSLSQIAPGQKVDASSDTFPGLKFEGEISAIDAKVDADTRNVQVRATIKNPQHKLLPGMYANVNIDAGNGAKYLTVPLNSVTFNPYGETVFVLTTAEQYKAEHDAKAKAEGTAPTPDAAGGPPQPEGKQLVSKQVFVSVGPTRGDQVAILKGLKVGDVVVTSGQLKLQNGTAVEINNKVQPLNNANPTTVDE
ncbi:efflux RND transporter periplasmic adaptor subunit [Stenotrophobium rhamnosiphilum]|uniref:Efflux transporter periplasmic adaptor subunit n=1 Tax=Stenotrophobium rhamnosiphilum TaxID=2029166 RepID=A0A2T5MGV3_9GAMM|nr:efflux RND transporter periplasmic adaptor subunit [Stenotrophobium rhamnosiphilum]PTU31803.1 efflux transporter periplasmic adaptor subunit [Stenotrophobium rhamnosiphilum]